MKHQLLGPTFASAHRKVGESIEPPDPLARIIITGKTLALPDNAPINTAGGYYMRGQNYATWGQNIASDAATAFSEGQHLIRNLIRTQGQYKGDTDPAYVPGQTDSYDPTQASLLGLVNWNQYWAEVDSFAAQGIWQNIGIDTNCGQSGNQAQIDYDYCTVNHCGNAAWPQARNVFTDPAFKADMITSWTAFAARGATVPKIFAYELMPEPMISGIVNSFDSTWVPALLSYFRDVIAAIRTVDATTPVVIGARRTYKASLTPEVLLAERTDVLYTINALSFTTRSRVNFPRDLYYLTDFRDASNVPVYIQSIGTTRADDPDTSSERAALSLCNSLGVSWTHWIRHQNTADTDGYSTDITDGSGGYTLKQPEADIVRYYTTQNLTDLEALAIAAATAETAEMLHVKADFSNAFQDSAGTTPVTAMAQPLGLLNPVVGTLTLSQATAGARPTINPAPKTIDARPVMFFDSVDDILSGSSAYFASGDDMTVIVAGIPANVSTVQNFLHVGTSATNPRYPFIDASASKIPNAGWRGDNTTLREINGTMNTDSRALVLAITKSGNNTTLYVNGISEGTSTGAIDGVTTPAALNRLRVGGNTSGGGLFNGPIVGVVLKRGVMTTAHIVDITRYYGYLIGAGIAV